MHICHPITNAQNYPRSHLRARTSSSFVPSATRPPVRTLFGKHNAITDMAVNPEKPLPLEFLAQIRISLMETQLMKMDLDAMKSYRKVHSLMDSDDFPEGTDAVMRDKRSRALSASSAGGSREGAGFE